MKNKKKTTGKTETEGKTSRVVLNLSLEQARELKGFIYIDGIANPNVNQGNKIFLQKIYDRIEKTINKHEEFQGDITLPQELDPRKSIGLEMLGDVMEAITQASQDAAEDEFAGEAQPNSIEGRY